MCDYTMIHLYNSVAIVYYIAQYCKTISYVNLIAIYIIIGSVSSWRQQAIYTCMLGINLLKSYMVVLSLSGFYMIVIVLSTTCLHQTVNIIRNPKSITIYGYGYTNHTCLQGCQINFEVH